MLEALVRQDFCMVHALDQIKLMGTSSLAHCQHVRLQPMLPQCAFHPQHLSCFSYRATAHMYAPHRDRMLRPFLSCLVPSKGGCRRVSLNTSFSILFSCKEMNSSPARSPSNSESPRNHLCLIYSRSSLATCVSSEEARLFSVRSSLGHKKTTHTHTPLTATINHKKPNSIRIRHTISIN